MMIMMICDLCRCCNGVLVNLQIDIDYKLIVVRVRVDQSLLCVSFLRGGSFSRPATSETFRKPAG